MGAFVSRGTAAVLVALLAGSVELRAEAAPPPADHHATYRTATGTLTRYDALTRILTVLSSTGTAEFLVAADARFWLGSRRLPVGQLRTHTGAQVTVAWSEVDGVRTTHTVRASESRAAQGH